jgi:histidinol dehydrogenase
MKRLEWSALSASERIAALARPQRRRDGAVLEVVRRIFDDVEALGAAGVRKWAKELDHYEPREIELSTRELDQARARIDAADLAALDLAVAQVRRYHEATAPKAEAIEVGPGVRVTRIWRPISTCGLYAPGGTAPLFSTLLMLAEPARAAGVRSRVLVTPPDNQGEVHPMMLAAAAATELESIFLLGGAQAIAALSFGAGIAKADKICGPGNAYVSEAKRYAASLPGGPTIDLPAGPSELLVIADAQANPAFVAADLLSQAEHDEDAQVLLVTVSDALLAAVEAELARQLLALPRQQIARQSLAQGRLIKVDTLQQAAEIGNLYAPEHLSLQVGDPEALAALIEHAGAIFMGAWSAETFGDYLCGPSHVLPTDGGARAWSGVSVASFMKSITLQDISEQGARRLAGAASRLARAEGLEGHARAAEMRGGVQ